MMETDDKLIRAFFAEQKQEIPDNGFSRRVMNRLPCRTSLLIKVWSLFIMLVAIILFLVFDGLQAIVTTARDIFVALVQNGGNIGHRPQVTDYRCNGTHVSGYPQSMVNGIRRYRIYRHKNIKASNACFSI